MMTFAEKLSSLSHAHGYTQRALAKALGLDQSAISRWLTRGSRPRPAMIKAIASHFGISVRDLLDEAVELPVKATHGHLAESAAEAKRVFPKNLAARQAAFELFVEKKHRGRESAELADFLRQQAAELRQSAADLEKAANELDSEC